MAIVEDRLAPRDGLNNYNVVLSRMSLPVGGGGVFVFSVTNSMLPVTELEINLPPGTHGLDHMTVEAHEALINVLRQLLFRAEKARLMHEKHAARPVPPPGVIERDDVDFVVERRLGVERRAQDEDAPTPE